MSGNARSRFAANLRSTGTSYAMSSPVSSAAMPPDALHSAITTPRMRAVSELAAERWVADWMAWLKTVEAPGGSAFSSAVHQVVHQAGS